MHHVDSLRFQTWLGVDVAASIREFFKANINRVLDELKTRGLTQEVVAGSLDVSSSHLSHWRKGQMPRDWEKLEKFCDLYGVEPGELFMNPTKIEAYRNGVKAFETEIIEMARRLADAANHDVVKRKRN